MIKKLSIVISFLTLYIICASLGIITYKNYNNFVTYKKGLKLATTKEEKEAKYNECLKKDIGEEEITEEILNMQEKLNNMLKKYNVAVYYEDLNSGFNYKYKETKVIYGASLIKLVDALYLYDKKIDLNNTMVYKSKYIITPARGMKTRKLGESITLNDLINYSLSVSDNTAHAMLLDYIGYNNLRDYGRSLGATAILKNSGEKYGSQIAQDTNIYLKKAYEIMTNTSKYKDGYLLREYMSNDFQNYLLLDNEQDIAHKYGSYDNYFHDIGIVFDENPYTISILTLHGNGNYKKIINMIHKEINELHLTFRNNRKNSCYVEIYENI